MKPDERPEPNAQDVGKSGDASETRGASISRSRAAGGDRDMGSALRSVYQKTVDESVPADLLDLLGKLD